MLLSDFTSISAIKKTSFFSIQLPLPPELNENATILWLGNKNTTVRFVGELQSLFPHLSSPPILSLRLSNVGAYLHVMIKPKIAQHFSDQSRAPAIITILILHLFCPPFFFLPSVVTRIFPSQ